MDYLKIEIFTVVLYHLFRKKGIIFQKNSWNLSKKEKCKTRRLDYFFGKFASPFSILPPTDQCSTPGTFGKPWFGLRKVRLGNYEILMAHPKTAASRKLAATRKSAARRKLAAHHSQWAAMVFFEPQGSNKLLIGIIDIINKDVAGRS
jgi:hypothetical protein